MTDEKVATSSEPAGRTQPGAQSRQQRWPAAQRNREPILAELRELLPARGTVLEIASGTGQHAAYFAEHLPSLTWQPSDVDADGLASIEAYVAASGLDNLLAPIVVDVTTERWGVDAADAVLCSNMIHIAPWACAVGLFAGAAKLLSEGGLLLTYGPYRFDGHFSAPSNEAFDRSLRSRDASWGVRDVTDMRRVADAQGLSLERTIDMPANNHLLVFRHQAPSPG